MELDARDHQTPDRTELLTRAVGAGLLVVLAILCACLVAATGCRTGVRVDVTQSDHVTVRLDGSTIDTAQGKSVPVDVGRGASASWGRSAGTVAGAAIGSAVGGPTGAAVGGALGGPVADAVERLSDDPTNGVTIDIVPGE